MKTIGLVVVDWILLIIAFLCKRNDVEEGL
jgi:hypothetical protein